MGIDISGYLAEGRFIKRENRFMSKVLIDNCVYEVHVPNTGRMKELLIDGAHVIVRKSNNPLRKTKWDLCMVYKGDLLVCIDSKLPNDLIYNELKYGTISEFQKYPMVKREVTYKNSRFDMYLNNYVERCLIEVKCVTFFKDGIARFPDAPTDRGRKHVRELLDAKKNGINGAIIFVVFTEDVQSFTPNDEMDCEFGRFLREAYIGGISIHAYSCKVTMKRIEIDKRLDIIL